MKYAGLGANRNIHGIILFISRANSLAEYCLFWAKNRIFSACKHCYLCLLELEPSKNLV